MSTPWQAEESRESKTFPDSPEWWWGIRKGFFQRAKHNQATDLYTSTFFSSSGSSSRRVYIVQYSADEYTSWWIYLLSSSKFHTLYFVSIFSLKRDSSSFMLNPVHHFLWLHISSKELWPYREEVGLGAYEAGVSSIREQSDRLIYRAFNILRPV